MRTSLKEVGKESTTEVSILSPDLTAPSDKPTTSEMSARSRSKSCRLRKRGPEPLEQPIIADTEVAPAAERRICRYAPLPVPVVASPYLSGTYTSSAPRSGIMRP